MKLPEKNTEEKFCDFDLGKYFLKGRQNSRTNPPHHHWPLVYIYTFPRYTIKHFLKSHLLSNLLQCGFHNLHPTEITLAQITDNFAVESNGSFCNTNPRNFWYC